MNSSAKQSPVAPMKVAILTVATNIHASRWINALAKRGLDVLVITQQPPRTEDYHPSVRFALLPFRGRLAYLLNAPVVRWIFRSSGADFLHVHYAGGYGASVWLSGVAAPLISVWGGDVYDVPRRSALHRLAVVRALNGACRITSTSHTMKQQVERLGITTPIDVVPFGVDTALFTPAETVPQRLVIGTVKTLKAKYGIDTLIRGFALALYDPAFQALDPELRIAGEGPEREDYEALAEKLGVINRVSFLGAIPHYEVAEVLRGFDIYAAISRDDSESFGVAIIEASACGIPVIVSDAGGLPEVVEDGVTGTIIRRNSPAALATALCIHATNPVMRAELGTAGRARVRRLYEWADNVDSMLSIYGSIVAEKRDKRSRSVAGRLAAIFSKQNFRQEQKLAARASKEDDILFLEDIPHHWIRDQKREGDLDIKHAVQFRSAWLWRLVQTVTAMAMVVVTSPMMILIAVFVLLNLGRPILFKQRRAGLEGALFTMIKFRSMSEIRDASGELLPDEQRVGGFGRFLRRSRLDELPELFNVILGSMNFIGPRPLLPDTINQLGPSGFQRGKVRPGLTGWAQISGNALLDIHDKVRLDLWYIDNRSAKIDLIIILETVRLMLLGDRVSKSRIEASFANSRR